MEARHVERETQRERGVRSKVIDKTEEKRKSEIFCSKLGALRLKVLFFL